MLPSFNKYVNNAVRCIVGLAGMVMLAGCASTLSARVTTYQQWPADAQGASYRIVPTPAQVNNLQFQSFADMVRAAIGPTGLVETTQGKPRFNVALDYGTEVQQTWVQQYEDPYFYNGFGPMFSPWGGFYGGHHGWGGGVFYTPRVVNIPVKVYKNSLTVVITDNQRQGAEVYRSSAVSGSSDTNLTSVMPYLARAVFHGFPGNNGTVRDITYERQR